MTNNEMVLNALIEYEENHYESEDDKWQKQINRLMSEYRNKVEKEKE